MTKRNCCTFALLAGISFGCQSVRAQEILFGGGSDTCAEMLSRTSQQRASLAVYNAWALGAIAGFKAGYTAARGTQMPRTNDLDVIETVRAFCTKNPNKLMGDAVIFAADTLLRPLKQRR